MLRICTIPEAGPEAVNVAIRCIVECLVVDTREATTAIARLSASADAMSRTRSFLHNTVFGLLRDYLLQSSDRLDCLVSKMLSAMAALGPWHGEMGAKN